MQKKMLSSLNLSRSSILSEKGILHIFTSQENSKAKFNIRRLREFRRNITERLWMGNLLV